MGMLDPLVVAGVRRRVTQAQEAARGSPGGGQGKRGLVIATGGRDTWSKKT